MTRIDGRLPDELRPVTLDIGVAPHAQGSVMVSTGATRVICAVTIEEVVPRWMKDQGVPGGWLTAEYAMLPYSTLTRKPRDITKGKLDGRSGEIQRLIGRALRTMVNLEALGPRTLWVDCDVLQADGGTRTASITGACVAVELALRGLVAAGKLASLPITHRVAAVSTGIVGGQPLLDLNYAEDKDAEVDMNVVMTDGGEFVEVQGSGEEAVFSRAQMDAMMDLAATGVTRLFTHQQSALSQ